MKEMGKRVFTTEGAEGAEGACSREIVT